MFQRSRYKVLINLDHIVVSFFLLLQDFQCFLCVSRCNNTVRYLSLDQKCCIFITHIRKRNKITKRGHSVSTACSCIRTCKRGKILPVHIIYPVDLCQSLCKRKSYSSTGRRYMFKRCSCRKSCCFLQIGYQLPAIKSIQEIDISRSSGKDLYRKLRSVCHINFCRFLIRVTAIF